MTTDDPRLTAYALNDPGLSAADRAAVEAHLTADADARRAFAETKRLAELLASGLAAEQVATPAEPFVTVLATPRPARRWLGTAAIAATVLLGATATLAITWQSMSSGSSAAKSSAMALQDRSEAEEELAAARSAPADAQKPSGFGGGGFGGGGIQGGIGGGGFGGGYGGGGIGGGGIGGNPAQPGMPGAGSGPAGMMGPAATDPNTAPADPSSKSAESKGDADRPDGGARGRDDQRRAHGPTPGEGGDAAKRETGEALPVDRLDKEVRERLAGKKKDAKPSDPAFQPPPASDPPAQQLPASGHERYSALRENGFVRVEGEAALSTFGIDVDTASYSIVRKYLTNGQLPPADAVRLEELVNYFPYRDKAPDGDDPFAVTVEMAQCPWRTGHRLARVGLKAKAIDADRRPNSNLVFLIDVSGSMNEPNKLPLVKASLKMLLSQLGETDRVAIVVYAGASGLVLDSTPASSKDKIRAAIDRLEPGGSTNGESGILLAYSVAAANFVKGGTNRVILCTDGDWNVGTTGTADLVRLIEKKRQTGVFLSVLGFGMGNLRDEMMVQLAGKGNGNYAYIDTLREANKALVEQLGGTLVTVAKDVKIQVEFNPAVVKAYRLLGYEKRALAAKDFADDKKDAGEMGAGHVVTALYEIVPADGTADAPKAEDGLRYQPAPAAKKAGVKADEAFVVKMRHKKPDGDTSTLRELPVADSTKAYAKASEDFRFAAAVASFAMLLRESPYRGSATFNAVIELADDAKAHDPGGYRSEFVELARRAKMLSGKQ